MILFYRIGVVIGIGVAFVVATIAISFLLFMLGGFTEYDIEDTLPWVMYAWAVVIFILTCVYFLDKLGMWG